MLENVSVFVGMGHLRALIDNSLVARPTTEG